ncbi:hypothetical protein [Streptomyces sp. HUAS TT7]|uniref:hypothetical protein n=1 Tax=Streptomyces sp. HUAS TT7 TaxID=3447507 RepID=UPI003F6556A9
MITTCQLTAGVAVTAPTAAAAPAAVSVGVPGGGVGLARQSDRILTAMFIDTDGVLNVAWEYNNGPWHAPVRISASVAEPGTPVALSMQTRTRFTAAFIDKWGRLNVAWLDDNGPWTQPTPISGQVAKPGGSVALAQYGDNQLTAAFVDSSGTLRTASVTGTGPWSPPAPTGGAVGLPGSPIALARHKTGQVDRMVATIIDNTGTLNTAYQPYPGGPWTAPSVVGYPLTNPGGGVALAQQNDSTLTASFTSTYGFMHVAWVNDGGNWNGPVSVDGLNADRGTGGGAIAMAKQTPGILVAASVDWWGYFSVAWAENNGAWNPPVRVGGSVAPHGAGVAVFKQSDNILTAAFIGNDGKLNVAWVEYTGAWAGPVPIN